MIHSIFSMSGSPIWIEGHCPASIHMSRYYGDGSPITDIDHEDNYSAIEGTAAHEMREFCLKLGIEPQRCLGMKFNNVEVDQEMVDGVSVDVNYVRRLTIQYGVKPLLEQRVTMSSLGRDDVFGTCDTIFLVPQKRLIHSIDFKYGRLPVEPTTPQLKGYNVSALDTFDLWGEVDTVKSSIIQPRYGHVDGPIRHTEYTIEETNEHGDIFFRSVEAAENPETQPNAGSWCKYCKARGNCRARLMRTLEIAYQNKPLNRLSDEEIEFLMMEIPAAKTHLDEVEEEARKRALRGHQFNEFKLVDSRPRRKCTDEKKLIAAAKKAGVSKERLYSKSLKSHSAISKVLPEKIVDKYYVRPPSSEILVPMSDKRVAKVVGSVPKGTFGKVSK